MGLISDIFERCAEDVKTRGLNKGKFCNKGYPLSNMSLMEIRKKDPEATFCALGYIYSETAGMMDHDIQNIVDVFKTANGINIYIGHWNDRPGINKSHVERAYRKAAEYARAAGM